MKILSKCWILCFYGQTSVRSYRLSGFQSLISWMCCSRKKSGTKGVASLSNPATKQRKPVVWPSCSHPHLPWIIRSPCTQMDLCRPHQTHIALRPESQAQSCLSALCKVPRIIQSVGHSSSIDTQDGVSVSHLANKKKIDALINTRSILMSCIFGETLKASKVTPYNQAKGNKNRQMP